MGNEDEICKSLHEIKRKISLQKGNTSMKKWYDEEYEFEIEVTGFLRGSHTEHYCRNGRRSAINIHVLMAVLSTKMDMEFVPKQ